MTIILPMEIISEILIFYGDLELCIILRDDYAANKVYNKNQYSFIEVCKNGQLEVLKWLHFNNKEGCTYSVLWMLLHYMDILK